MKKFAVMAVAALVAASAFAASIENSYIVVNGTWYTGDNSYEQPAGFFNGNTLGTLDTPFTLGAELQDKGEDDAAANPLYLNYCFDIAQGENWFKGEIAYDTWTGEYNRFKAEEAFTVDYDAFVNLDAGTHTIDIYFSKVTDGGETIYNQPGPSQNYQATFTKTTSAVPEPATMSLLGLGALAMVIRRKLSK